MPSNFTISIRTPASSYFLRMSPAFLGSVFNRHSRSCAAATLAASPRPPAIAAAGAPIASSIGCERISTAFTPSWTVRCSVSSALIVRLPKLYGTFSPTCTPAHFEFGLACQAETPPPRGSSPAAGTASIIFPSSRRVYSIGPPEYASAAAVYHPCHDEHQPLHGRRSRGRRRHDDRRVGAGLGAAALDRRRNGGTRR